MRQRDFVFSIAFAVMVTPSLLAQEAPAKAITVQAVPSSGGARTVVIGPDGKPMAVPAGTRIPPGARPTRSSSPTPAKKGEDASKNKTGDAKDKKADENESKVLTRPDQPPMPADPAELDARPNSNGLVKLNFRYQAWPDVLEWLADISKMSLAWQELPKDFLNLRTQREYSIVETRDLINRHLLARGFTLLENGEVLRAVAIAKLNPAMVPRLRAADLEQLVVEQPYKFVKVSFSLDWLLADQAAKELEPMLSANGKLVPLTNTNRIEGMDAAINLHEINMLLEQEQSGRGESPLVSEFVLVNARATDVLADLETLLGLEAKKAPAMPMSSSQMRALQQQQQQMAQQMAQRGGKAPTTAAKKEAPVNLVVNKRKNSILAHAPPDKMAIIEQAIKALDVRTERTDSLFAKPTQLEIYRLNNLDPAALAKTLEDLGDLQPSTRLEVDEKNNALIVYGSLIDQATIRQLIERLDGNSRHFEVVRLRRLAADYVAGTVEFMMVGEEEKKEQPRYYDYYSSRYGSQNKKEENSDKFRVDADVQNNMLLLWANEQEVESVMQLLVKLGEIPPQGGNPDKVRILTTIAPEDAAEFLDKLRRAWPSLSPNKLNLPDPPKLDDPDPKDEESEKTGSPNSDAAKEVRVIGDPGRGQLLEVALLNPSDASDSSGESADVPVPATPERKPAEAAANQPEAPRTPPRESPAIETPSSPTEPSNEELLRRFLSQQEKKRNAIPPPINLSFAPDGSLVITSEDTAALDVLEELISQTAPPEPDYKIYKLQYADAYWVMDNIEAFFEEDEEEDNSGYSRYFYGYPQQQQTETRSRLSQRRKLKFIYDLDTNSILVQGADARQRKTIEDLIEVYDQPEPTNSQSARVSTPFLIRYSKATIIADAIKDVYRDLLSSNDKALQSNNPEKKNRETREATYIFGGSGGDEPDRTQVKFKGKLSIGIDEMSNTLLVSAEGENLMKNVGEMIKTLDEAAKPLSSYSIIHLNGNTNASRVREVLSTLFSEGNSGASSAGEKPPSPPQNGQNSPRGQGQRTGNQAEAAVQISPN